MSVRICFHDHTEVQIEPIHSKKKRVKYLISEMFTIPFIIGALFFQNILAGTVLLKMIYGKNHWFLFFFHCYVFLLPGEISKDVSAQFLNRNRHGDSRCDTDQKYCESHRVRCMVRYSINCLDAQICVYTLLQSNIYKDEAQLLLM